MNFIFAVILLLVFAAVWVGFAVEVGSWLKGEADE